MMLIGDCEKNNIIELNKILVIVFNYLGIIYKILVIVFNYNYVGII